MAKIEAGEDKIKLTLTFHHRQMLRLIALRGGRVDYQFNHPFVMPANFPQGAKPPTEEEKLQIVKNSDDSVRKMESMGLILVTQIIGHGKHELVLTDMGRQVIEQMSIQVVPGLPPKKD